MKKEELSKKIENNTQKIEDLLKELNEFKQIIKDIDYEPNNKIKKFQSINDDETIDKYQKEIQKLESETTKKTKDEEKNKNIINAQIKLISRLKEIIFEISKQKNESDKKINLIVEENNSIKNELSSLIQEKNKNSEKLKVKDEEENILKDKLYGLLKQNSNDGRYIQKYTEEYQNKISELKKIHQTQIDEKNSRINNLERIIAKFRDELFNLKASVNEIQLKEEAIKRKEEFFKKIIKSKEDILLKIETELLRLKNDSKFKDDIINKLKTDLFKKDKIISAKENELEDTLNNKLKIIIQKYEANSRLLNQAHRDKEEKINSLTIKFESELEAKNNEIINLNKLTTSLREELTLIKKEINNVELIEETIKKKEEQFKEKIFLKNQIITRLETDLLRLNNILKDKESKETELKNSIYTKDKEIIKNNLKLKEIISKENIVKEDISALSNLLKDTSKKINLSEEELRLKNQAIKKLLSDTQNLEKINAEKNHLIGELQKKNNDIDLELNKTRSTFDKFKQEISKKEKYIVEIENENNIFKTKIEHSKKALDTLLKENITLKKVLKENTIEFSKKSIELDKKLYSDNKKNSIEIKTLNNEYENRIEELIKEHMNEELNLKLRIENLTKIIEEQNKIIMEKREMEKKIAIELTTKIREALMLGSNRLKDLLEFNPEEILKSQEENKIENKTIEPTNKKIINLEDIKPPEEPEIILKQNNHREKELSKKEFRKSLGVDSKKSNLDSLVKMALSHKESPEKIIKTLTKSGYNINEIKKALNKNIKIK